jgi:activator of HSP90 ATPase
MDDLMRSVIRNSIPLPVPAEVLYESYLDPTKHAEITGTRVTISAQSGSPFSAFGGALSGTTLVAIPCRLIVQSWRSTNFHPEDPDSTVILNFVPEGCNGRIDLVHLDVPEVDFQGVIEAWENFYWTPWRRYLGR